MASGTESSAPPPDRCVPCRGGEGDAEDEADGEAAAIALSLRAACDAVRADRRFELLGAGDGGEVRFPFAHAAAGGAARAAKRARVGEGEGESGGVGGGGCLLRASGATAEEVNAAAEAAAAAAAAGCTTVHFQLVGASLYGLSREQLETGHGVDLSALNEAFARRLNGWVQDGDLEPSQPVSGHLGPSGLRRRDGAPGAKPCLTSGLASVPGHAQHLFTVRYVAGGACSLEAMWPTIRAVAEAVMSAEYARLPVCRCDL
uniref:Uncharacterized protein n=2 Tax=Emiliania huxleyi TaxID=2903 RepID=A0A7S3STL8_EMIHU